MTVAPARGVLRPAGPHGLIGFGEAYLTGGLGRRRPRRLPHRAGRRPADPGPVSLQKARALVVARPPRAQRSTPPTAATTSPTTTTCPTTSSALPRRDAELLLGAVRHPDPHVRRPSRGHPARGRGRHRAAGRGPGPQDRAAPRPGGVGAAPASSRSAPAGASSRSAPPVAARGSARVTLSSEQLELARERVAAAGWDRVRWSSCDYRAIDGRAAYDAVVSVEMIEAVGQSSGRTYSRSSTITAPGGRSALQAIADAARPDAGDPSDAHVDQQVHLPGRLPPLRRRRSKQVTREHTALRRLGAALVRKSLRRDAAPWDDGFRAAQRPVRELGFDATFQRMWHFYLEYSRAGFASATSTSSRSCWSARRAPRPPAAGASSRLRTAGAAAPRVAHVAQELLVLLRAGGHPAASLVLRAGSRPARGRPATVHGAAGDQPRRREREERISDPDDLRQVADVGLGGADGLDRQ